MNAPWDGIVIGGGVNGLVAATCLARAGLRLLLLERREALGGLAGSLEFAPGFRGDPVGLDGGWMPAEVRRAVGLAAGDLQYDWSSEVVAPGPEGGWLRLPPDPRTAATELRRFSTRDAERWPAFCSLLARLAGFLQAVYAAPPPRIDATGPVELVRLLGLARRLRGLGRREMTELLRVIPMPVQELLDDWFESDLLKGLLGAGGVTQICQGPRSGGTTFILLNRQIGRPVGALRSRALVRGGADRLVRLLSAAAQRAGVEVRSSAEVARVTVAQERVTGVLLTSGEAIAARRVLSSADPHRTLLGLLDPVHLDPDLIHAARQVKFRGVTARVYLAIDGLPGLVPGQQVLRGVLALSPSLDSLERAYDAAKYGRVSERPLLEVTFPSLADPSMAPAGKQVDLDPHLGRHLFGQRQPAVEQVARPVDLEPHQFDIGRGQVIAEFVLDGGDGLIGWQCTDVFLQRVLRWLPELLQVEVGEEFAHSGAPFAAKLVIIRQIDR